MTSDQDKRLEHWCERDQRFFNSTEWLNHLHFCNEHPKVQDKATQGWRVELEFVPDGKILGGWYRKWLIGPGVKVNWSDSNVLEALNLEHEKRVIAEGYLAYRRSKESAALQRPGRDGNYGLPCDRCGQPHYIDTSIPSETWNLIVGRAEPGGDKWGLLCTDCIGELCHERGITVEAEFYAHRPGLVSKIYDSGREAEQLAEIESLERSEGREIERGDFMVKAAERNHARAEASEAREAALVEALRNYGKHKPLCRLGMVVEKCPDCGWHLEVVRQSHPRMLNEEQFNAVKAGDYCCTGECTSADTKSRRKYFWKYSLAKEVCSCGLEALISPPGLSEGGG